MKLKNWKLAINPNIPHLVTKEQIEGYTQKPLVETQSFLIGEIYGREGFSDGSLISTSRVKDINKEKAMTKSGSIYNLGNEAKSYELFKEALQNNKPVITNWIIGLDGDRNFVLSANMLVDGEVTYIEDIIIGQDLDTHSIDLAKSGNVFVDWPSINFCLLTSIQLGSINPKILFMDDNQMDLFGANMNEIEQAALKVSYTDLNYTDPDHAIDDNPIYQLIMKKRF